MRVPKTMRLSYMNYDIVEVKQEELDELKLHPPGQTVGACSPFLGLIRYSETIPDKRRASVILHEVLHACIYEGKIDMPHDKEEELVVLLEAELSRLFHHNPKLITYFMESFK